jgi:uncharacterized membrane protein
MADTSPERAYAPYDPRQARGRILLAIAAGLVVLGAMPSEVGWSIRFVAAWDAGALMMLALSWWIIARADAAETRRRAASEDPGRSMVWAIAVLSSGVSVFAATHAMKHARDLSPHLADVSVALSFGAVIAAWVITHTSYTLRYAHLYYREEGEGEGGLTFPGDGPPCDMDFAYFAFVIGMCFQVSDVTITSPLIRRGALAHSILSFAYNSVILALTLNLVFGFLG